MVKQIKWTGKALRNLSAIISYLQNEWSDKVAENFALKVKNKLEILRKFPFSGSPSGIKPGYNKIVITKHNTLYYRVKKNEIVILNIYDSRQNPDNKKF